MSKTLEIIERELGNGDRTVAETLRDVLDYLIDHDNTTELLERAEAINKQIDVRLQKPEPEPLRGSPGVFDVIACQLRRIAAALEGLPSRRDLAAFVLILSRKYDDKTVREMTDALLAELDAPQPPRWPDPTHDDKLQVTVEAAIRKPNYPPQLCAQAERVLIVFRDWLMENDRRKGEVK